MGSLATGLILAVFKSFLVLLMLKLEIPIDLANPFSTSCSTNQLSPSHSALWATDSFHGLPGRADVLAQGDVKLVLAVVGLDNVLPLGADTLRRVNLEVDLN